MKAIIKQRKGIDWDKAHIFLDSIAQNLCLDLEDAFSNLEKFEPYIDIETHPPRILFQFIRKGKTISDGNIALFSRNEEKELKEYQENISMTIARIAKEYSLNVMAGHLHTNYDEKNKRVVRKMDYDLGFYTFKPKYGDFVK